jgi:hypothetical protein
MIGKTITHYQITSHLGKVGMGEIYRVKDHKLSRDVSIKILSAHRSTNPRDCGIVYVSLHLKKGRRRPVSRKLIVVPLLMIVLGTASIVFGQAAASTAALKGLVTDPKGAPVPEATVTVLDASKGTTRTAITNNVGQYQVPLLPPGIYKVKVDLQGFAPQVKYIRITVGQVVVFDFQLAIEMIEQTIEVTAHAPLIEIERVQQSNTIEEQFIRNLPIDRRDYLTFSLLAPSIVDSDALADDADFRLAQAPQSGLSFYGNNGRGNNITVDGSEANSRSSGVRPTLSQEAVQEFQINRSNYSAEFGAASGGVINIVSKSGDNKIRGSIFGFFRHDSLDAADPFAVDLVNDRLTRIDPTSNRQQYGGTFSFPLKRNRSFIFGAFEKLNRDESASVPVLTDYSIFQLTASQTTILDRLAADTSTTPISCIPSIPTAAMLPPTACAQALRNALATPQSTVDLFRRNSGVFPFTANITMFSVRLDHQINSNNQLAFRYNYTNGNEQNQKVRALVGFSRGNLSRRFDSTFMASWTHMINPQLVNEVHAQWAYNSYKVMPNDPIGPELNIFGFGFFNRDMTLPNFALQRRYEVIDNVSYSRGTHSLKFGGRFLIDHGSTEAHAFFPGQFNFGELPGSLLSPQFATTKLTSLQAFNLGSPQSYIQGFGDPVVALTLAFAGIYWQDSWKVRPTFTVNYGLRYELDKHTDPMPLDANNFAPRIGFAWDPFNDRKTAIRGGYGIFYSPINGAIDYMVNALNALGPNNFRQIAVIFAPLTGVPGITNPITGRSLTSPDIFQTLRAQEVIGVPAPTRTITQEDLRQFGVTITHEGPIPPLTVLFDISEDYVNAYSQQASLGFEREIASQWALSVNYIFSHTQKITRPRNQNPLATAPIGPLGIRQWNVPPCMTNPTSCFARPLILQDNITESTARAFYHGFILEVNKRLSHHFSLSGSYTLSKAIDDVTDFNGEFKAMDQTNLRAERSLSSFDQRHKLVIYGVLESPWRDGSGSHPLARVFADFVITPMLRGNSSRPFNLLVGSDINGDRHPNSDRPPFAGRNTGRGPSFWAFDVRVARWIELWSEKGSIELMFEAFNLFNRLNYASINNTVGVIPPPFNLTGRWDRQPSEPLGFTSVFSPRRIQLGFRLSF